MQNANWQTKPTDRFVLKWIKRNLSARITPKLVQFESLAPWHITLAAACMGCMAGLLFACGFGMSAGCVAAAAQILDGVDGQLARMTDKQTKGGAFWDSVMDRYADGALVIGLSIYLLGLPFPIDQRLLIGLGAAAIIGSNLISYSSARAAALGLDLGKPTLAGKGTRSTVIVICAIGSFFWPGLPIAALVYLALHTNLVVIRRLIGTLRNKQRLRPAISGESEKFS